MLNSQNDRMLNPEMAANRRKAGGLSAQEELRRRFSPLEKNGERFQTLRQENIRRHLAATANWPSRFK